MNPILFVLGPARGGTTYLTDLLDDWFDYGMGPEGTYIGQFYNQARKYGELGDKNNLKRLVEDLSKCEMLEIMRHAWSEDIRVDIKPEHIMSNINQPDLRHALYAVLAAVMDVRGKQHLGSKDPSFWRYWPVLEELFGDNANYLCIVRDGRDVALSLLGQNWGERSAYIAAKNWVAFIDAVDELSNSAAGSRFKLIKYEDLLSTPASTIATIEAFTKVRLPSEKRDELVSTITNSKFAGNFNKWKHKMPSKDIATFETVAGHWLEHYGYDMTGSARPINCFERGFYETEETIRKVMHTISRHTGANSWQK